MAHSGNTCHADPDLPVPIDGPTSVLVLGSRLDADVDGACAGLLSPAEPEETDYLAVSLTESPDERVDHWRSHVSTTLPAKAGVIGTGELTRSATLVDGAGDVPTATPGTSVQFSTVTSPSDLTGLGIQVNECLSSWAGDGNRTVFCFDSLTTLLQCTDLQRTFRFLHVLVERLRTAGAVAHFHLDHAAHDDRTLATLRSLFDWVIEPGPDGEWQARQRPG